MPPFAVLKAANGQHLTAIGQGLFTVATIAVMAFVFADQDLASNLLGLIPFANAGCTSTFKPYTFHVFPPGDQSAIVSGTRTDSSSLWHVRLQRGQAPQNEHVRTDGIPPPHSSKGTYVEAHAASHLDNASYVRYVHASLGYPAPTTFLRAVEKGLITGPSQFPRLTPKLVRKHLPNAMATKGHLDGAPIKPVLLGDVPNDRVITYVNPVCVEKINDDGSVKFRTRLTIDWRRQDPIPLRYFGSHCRNGSNKNTYELHGLGGR